MSRTERAFCCGALWRTSSTTIARELRAQHLGGDVLEIGAGGGSVAQQLLSSDHELAWTAIDIDPHMAQAAATRLGGFSRYVLVSGPTDQETVSSPVGVILITVPLLVLTPP